MEKRTKLIIAVIAVVLIAGLSVFAMKSNLLKGNFAIPKPVLTQLPTGSSPISTRPISSEAATTKQKAQRPTSNPLTVKRAAEAEYKACEELFNPYPPSTSIATLYDMIQANQVDQTKLNSCGKKYPGLWMGDVNKATKCAEFESYYNSDSLEVYMTVVTGDDKAAAIVTEGCVLAGHGWL